MGVGMSWDQKLKRLQENLGVTAEGLAGALGITTRTLADFLKPGGREPTGPVQRLIDLLLGEMDSQDLARKPKLNLVIIHGDFRVAGGLDPDPVDAIVNMHSAGGRNNEFHYITVAPKRDAKWAIEGLSRRRIQPHFFSCEDALNTQEAQDCYFTATSMWLATQAMRRDLAHITLAADAKKYWPLAKELRELAEVDVTMVLEGAVDSDANQESLLKGIGIGVADLAGRKFGSISSLRRDAAGKISYGFIAPERADATGKVASIGSPLFFSWNHMLKDKNGVFDQEIGDLVEGDKVSFGMGMNYQGPCAINVALVGRPNGVSLPDSVSAKASVPRRAKSEELELLEIIKDAVTVCADEDGWALSANVGSRASVLVPNFRGRLQAVGYQKISGFAAAYPSIFEIAADGQDTRYSAACMRLKPALR